MARQSKIFSRPFKVVMITDWFAEKMGYSENLLPKAMAKLPVEVHVITSDLQPNFEHYEELYEPFLGPRQQPPGTKQMYGFTLHRLPHGLQFRGVQIKGLYKLLKQLKPDVVQCFTLHWLGTYQAALYQPLLKYALFLEEHTHLSVYKKPVTVTEKIKNFIFTKLIGYYLNLVSVKCYPIAPDVEFISWKYLGYAKHKMEIVPLGVDTDIFKIDQNGFTAERRINIRAKFGFKAEDIICIYSGKFTEGKKPLLLAKAIHYLQQESKHYKALFIGAGSKDYSMQIESCDGCYLHPFVQWYELADFYRAADIGVWPSQESTSQLDAAACGLPIILSNHIKVKERIEGNGLLYKEDDPIDLAEKIVQLNDSNKRHSLGTAGAKKMEAIYSWNKIARDRLEDYQQHLNKSK